MPSTSRSFGILPCHCDINICWFTLQQLYHNAWHGNAKLITVSVAQSVALTYKMMTVSNSFWIILPRHTIQLILQKWLEIMCIQSGPVEWDDTEERLGCHIPNWPSAPWVTDFVETCVFMETEDYDNHFSSGMHALAHISLNATIQFNLLSPMRQTLATLIATCLATHPLSCLI